MKCAGEKAHRALADILDYRTDGSEADVRFLAGAIPIVALTPLDKEQPNASQLDIT